tara:strand:- start:89 stop:1369 length:1281 start_codon:yes stop_codon:yes gene_type:complete
MVQVATDEAEGAQALFCYIADVLGAKKTQKEFKPFLSGDENSSAFFVKYKSLVDKAYSTNAVKTTKTKDAVVKYIKNNDDWFMSSLKISEYLITQIDDISTKFKNIKQPGIQDLFYRHGDDEIMGVMSKLFKAANDQNAKVQGTKFFGDINKWTPADIYFASAKARKMFNELANDSETKKGNLTFAELNETIGDTISSGDLLPLSLKKVDKNVVVKQVNFSRKDEEKLLADTFCKGVQKYIPMKGTLSYTNKSFKLTYEGGRDIYVLVESGGKAGRLQFRHTPASGGKPSKGFKTVFSYKGSSALGGQVVGIPILTNLIASVDQTFGNKLKGIFNKNYVEFEKAVNAYKKQGGGDKRYNSNDKKLKDEFNDDIGAISALTIMNPLRLAIDSYFKKKGKAQDNVVRALFAYTASRTVNSAPFVIAKD